MMCKLFLVFRYGTIDKVNHMKESYFINEAFDTAIKSFLEVNSKKESLLYYSFLVVVIRTLSFIYGESDIMNPYYLKNSVALINNFSKYGMSKMDITTMFEELLLYYKIECEDENKTFNEKIRILLMFKSI